MAELISIAFLQEQRPLVYRLVEAYGCSSPRVFGSVAAGTNGADSDVDLLVDGFPKISMLTLVKLEQALTEAFGVPFDVHMPTTLPMRWRQAALDSSIPL